MNVYALVLMSLVMAAQQPQCLVGKSGNPHIERWVGWNTQQPTHSAKQDTFLICNHCPPAEVATQQPSQVSYWTVGPVHQSSIELLDVPAVQEPSAEEFCRKAAHSWRSRQDCMDVNGWTCADKSRILLTDESGGKHCVKFQ